MKDFESNRTQIMNSIENRVRQAYNSGYDTGFHDGEIAGYDKTDIWQDGFHKGLDEAWECAKRLIYLSIDGGMTYDDISKAFGFHVTNKADIFRTNTAYEAIEKIRAYESKLNEPEEKKIEVTEENFRKVCEALKYITEKECCSYDYGDVCDMADAYLEQTKGAAE